MQVLVEPTGVTAENVDWLVGTTDVIVVIVVIVYVFDYRRGRLKPLGGRYQDAPEQMTALDFLSRILKPLDLPREMLTYTEATMRGGEGSAPQLAPTAMQFGVIAAWSVLDLAAGRTLRAKVRVAIPDLLMPRRRRVVNEAARVVQLVRLKALLEVKRVRSGL